MDFTDEEVIAGQAIYTQRALGVYDLVVLSISNPLIWKCPTARLVAHYDRHLTANHLDVGIGTGYFLDSCRFPSPEPRIAMLDLNQNALDFASRRIARYHPQTYLRNVLEPISIGSDKFDSVGINYLLHCLPGTIKSKAVIFDHLKALMNPTGVLFGSTLLQGGVPRTWLARRLMAMYNKKGIFSNQQDTLEELTGALEARFRDISVEVIGCAALFTARD